MTRAAPEPRTGGSALLDPSTDPRWQRFVHAAHGAMIFHHPAWLGLIRRRYGYPVAACCTLDGAGHVTAGLPLALVRRPPRGRRLVAFPFSDVCPPIGTTADMSELGRAVADLGRRIGTPVEVRGALPGAQQGAQYFRHVLPLAPQIGEVERQFTRSSVMRGVRRARREGLVAERRTDADALDGFYRLHLVTRSRLGAPTQPRAFIRDLEALFRQGLGFVLTIRRDGGPTVAAAVFLHHGGVLTYKYGASDPRALGMRPNNLLFWEAIRWGCEHEMTALDLGRSDLEQRSLCEFKRSWGAEEQLLEYVHVGPGAPRAADRGVLGRTLAAGLRRTPPVASRLVGEVLYRYAG
jgi:CelD/BcsL family acetyltransferase involved in cellulose biosynthesis